MPVVPLSEHCGISLRETLIKFLNAVDYSFMSYPQIEDLEIAVRNEILSFGIELRPEWETVLRTSCTLIGASYIKLPFEVQFSITV